MTISGASNDGATRIHAIILTRDRPRALKRCLDTAVPKLGAADALTVLDDSSANLLPANAAVVAHSRAHAVTQLTHARAARLHEVVARATDGQSAVWQSRTAPRDIAPLRNLELLLATLIDAQTTIMVDDDMCNFDLEATHWALHAHNRGSAASVVGATIAGTSEQDTITKLSDAIRALFRNRGPTVLAEDLFRVPSDSEYCPEDARALLSGGYLAFRLPAASLFAFPPGYNEDWLWCLLHRVSGETFMLRVDQVVIHDPPALRQPTRDDLFFELAGDLILDCLVERGHGELRRPESTLENLADYTPDASVTPSVRAESLLQQAWKLQQDGYGRALAALEIHGLSVLREMQHSKILATDGASMLRAWSVDAVAKHRSFATTLTTATVPCAIQAALKEGRP